jgi:site-specific recombinase XerD
MTAHSFQGLLARNFEAFLAYRRDLATHHQHISVVLRHLDRFLVEHAPNAQAITNSLVSAWMATLTRHTGITRRNYFRVLRQFCVFQARSDPGAFIPSPLMCPRVTARFQPYVYSEQEIRALLIAAAHLTGGLRPHTYVALLLVLYTTGVRIGEALSFRLGDLDHDRAVLHIRAGKFRKSRLIPITASLLMRLDQYLEQRHQAGAPTGPDAALFWSPRGGHYSLVGIQHGLSRLLRTTCGKRPGRGTGPRVHDIRHAFAIHRLLRWYREGADVQGKLPLLATYLGHCSFVSTQWYLRATPELLAEASRRFHHDFGALVQVPEECNDDVHKIG